MIPHDVPPVSVPPDAYPVLTAVGSDTSNEMTIYARVVDGKVETFTTETNPPVPKPQVLVLDDTNSQVVEALKTALEVRQLEKPLKRPMGIIGHVGSSKLAILSLLGALGAKGQQALMVHHEEPRMPSPEQLRRHMALMDNDEPFTTHGDGDTRGRKAYNKSKRPRWRQ